jgi:hypothetical protein
MNKRLPVQMDRHRNKITVLDHSSADLAGKINRKFHGITAVTFIPMILLPP